MPDRLYLKKIALSGFKSFGRESQEISFGNVTLLIGSNGVGKSNIVSFFQMLNSMTKGTFALFIGKGGGADTFLHYGSKETEKIKAELKFESQEGAKNTYRFTLAHASPDTLIFAEEHFDFQTAGYPQPCCIGRQQGGRESVLHEFVEQEDALSRVMLGVINNCKAYQFHDTSATAKIKRNGYINDTGCLRNGAENLAAFLYEMKASQRWYYDRIIRYIRSIFPDFRDFELKPTAENSAYIRLNWYEQSSDYLFGPHQLSDGTLRFMALASLLLQPSETLPKVIVIDEPELGLHPSAISILTGMVRTASKHAQVILATQSPRLVDEFQPEEIVVMEREKKKETTVFKPLDTEKLADWLNEYCLSELWEKNVLGGKP